MKQVLLRILAVFAASGLSVVGAGAIAGVDLWKAVLMAGVGGVATVVEGLARAYMDDGKIDADEINDVFISPSPYPSWVLDESFEWVAPTPMPTGSWTWDEPSVSWKEINT